jgi:hypothetical protein
LIIEAPNKAICADFQCLTLVASTVVDAGAGGVPVGRLHPALLDAALHGMIMRVWIRLFYMLLYLALSNCPIRPANLMNDEAWPMDHIHNGGRIKTSHDDDNDYEYSGTVK